MEGFADIEGPVRVDWLLWLGLGGLAILILFLLAGIAWMVLRRRKAGGAVSALVQRSPLEIALERLESLHHKGLNLEADPFIVEVSDIVRDYLERSLAIPAKEQTSEEFLLALQNRPGLPQILQDHMPTFLAQCDMVKFARQSLAGQQRDDLLDTAENVVKETDSTLHPGLNPSGKGRETE